jgi:hypothetical protein
MFYFLIFACIFILLIFGKSNTAFVRYLKLYRFCLNTA